MKNSLSSTSVQSSSFFGLWLLVLAEVVIGSSTRVIGVGLMVIWRRKEKKTNQPSPLLLLSSSQPDVSPSLFNGELIWSILSLVWMVHLLLLFFINYFFKNSNVIHFSLDFWGRNKNLPNQNQFKNKNQHHNENKINEISYPLVLRSCPEASWRFSSAVLTDPSNPSQRRTFQQFLETSCACHSSL